MQLLGSASYSLPADALSEERERRANGAPRIGVVFSIAATPAAVVAAVDVAAAAFLLL